MSKRKTYLQNAALLTGSGLVLRALGMGFRVVLAAYLGGEGMGLYQLILALYMVFVSFATAGINVASARLAAQSLARGSGMAETLRGLCFTALGFGTTAMVAQAVLAGPCARYLLHDIRAETALLILAPSLPFMAVSGAVRGCFLAARRVQPNITAQLIEQLVRMAVAVAGLRALAQWGAGYGCAAVLLGNTVSEGVSCGVMLAFAARTPEFVPRPGAPLHPYTRKELYDILWPVEGSRLLASALQAAESSLIPYTLALCTGSRTEAVAQYGSLNGGAVRPADAGNHPRPHQGRHRRHAPLDFHDAASDRCILAGGRGRICGARCAAGAVRLPRRRGRTVCADFRLCRAVHVPGKQGGRRAEGPGGAAGDVPLFAAGLDIAHHSHLVCCAEIWHDGVPGGDGGVEFDDVLLEYEEDDGANKKAFPRWGKAAEGRMRGGLAMIAR